MHNQPTMTLRVKGRDDLSENAEPSNKKKTRNSIITPGRVIRLSPFIVSIFIL